MSALFSRMNWLYWPCSCHIWIEYVMPLLNCMILQPHEIQIWRTFNQVSMSLY